MKSFVLKNIGKKFGTFFAIRHVSFSLPMRGFFAIKGKSGSGKSTLLNLLSGLLRPDEGSLYFLGQNLSSFSKERLRAFRAKETAMLFQHYNLIDGATGLENVALPLQLSGMSKKAAFSKAKTLFTKFGIRDLEEKNVDLCSGGEKQRIALLRALAGNPKILFCDEPTGALDEENAKFVMKVLKEQSKKKLIIMVSHNEELIEEFADSILLVENHRVRFIKEAKNEEKDKKPKEAVLKKPRGWTFFFTKRNIRRNLLIDAISFLALLVGFSSLLITAGFFQGSGNVLSNEPSKSVIYRKLSISEKSYLETEGSPLRLVRKQRPSMEKITTLLEKTPKVEVLPDYSFFFPRSHAFYLGEEQFPATFFEPYRSFDETIISKGSAPKEGNYECLVNEKFLEAFPKASIGQTISFSENYSLTYRGSKDAGTLRFSFSIVGVVSEFSFLNSEQVYVLYKDVEAILKQEPMPSLSELLEKETSAAEIGDYLPDNHSATGYQYLLFAEDNQTAESLFQKKKELEEKEDSLEISSDAFETKTAFESLINAFSLSLTLFVVIAFVGVGLILGMTAYSAFMKRKKETAMLLVLGAPKRQVGRIYLMEETSLAILASGISLALSPLLEMGADAYFNSQFAMKGLIKIPMESFFGIPFLLPVAVLLFAILFSSIACLLPLGAIGRMPLAEILHDE